MCVCVCSRFTGTASPSSAGLKLLILSEGMQQMYVEELAKEEEGISASACVTGAPTVTVVR